MSKLTPRYQDIDNFTKQFFLRQDSRKCSPKTGFLNLIGTVFGSSPWQHYFFNRFVVQYKKGENNHSSWFYTERTFEKNCMERVFDLVNMVRKNDLNEGFSNGF